MSAVRIDLERSARRLLLHSEPNQPILLERFRGFYARLIWRRAGPKIIEGPLFPAPAFTGLVIRR
jgi:hypothetical protein